MGRFNIRLAIRVITFVILLSSVSVMGIMFKGYSAFILITVLIVYLNSGHNSFLCWSIRSGARIDL